MSPIICSIGAFGLTYLGVKLYSDRLAKLSQSASAATKRKPNKN